MPERKSNPISKLTRTWGMVDIRWIRTVVYALFVMFLLFFILVIWILLH